MQRMKVQEILDLNDETINKAVFQPKVSRKAQRVFKFLRDNDNLTTTVSGGGGMGLTTGLDRFKLAELAKGYNLNIFKYMFAVDMFERGLLNMQKENLDKVK